MENNLKYIIIGRTCSGKDTFAKLLQGQQEGMEVLKSHTDRPTRENEKYGQSSHIFISKSEMDKLYEDKSKVIMRTNIGYNRYCTLKEDYDKADIIITDPIGLQSLIYNAVKEHKVVELLKNTIIIYLYTNILESEKRFIDRSNKDIEETKRNFHDRWTSEDEVFTKFEEFLCKNNIIGPIEGLNNTVFNIMASKVTLKDLLTFNEGLVDKNTYIQEPIIDDNASELQEKMPIILIDSHYCSNNLVELSFYHGYKLEDLVNYVYNYKPI